jgi:C-terminal processing protease CtpA/Prc
MSSFRIVLTLVSIVIFPSTAAAQESPTRLEGQWRGTLITDAFRGAMELTVVRSSAAWNVHVAVTVGDRTSSSDAPAQVVSGDSIRFTSNVGGADASFIGSQQGDSLAGTMEARREGQLLGRGRWSLRRASVAASAAPQAAKATAAAIFDEVWTLVDTRYGNFPAKGIDWALIRALYRDEAASATSDSALAAIISRMLSHLNDNHISLKVKDSTYRPNGEIDRSSFVADTVVARRFVGSGRKANSGQWTYAWLADSIGYLKIDGFQNDRAARAEIDTILTGFRGARGIVIDLRKHFGGDDRAANQVINRFASRRTLYMTSRTRGDGGHGDFLPPREFFAEPAGPWQFTRPVVILTSRRTVSAGENFLLGMRELPQVTVVGDVTSGAFADVGHYTLGNGWQLNFPFNRFVDRNGVSWEGVGLAPDIRYVARPADIAAGRDVLLDLGVKVVKAAGSLRD